MRGKKGVFTEGTTARFGSYFDAGAMPEVLPAVTRQIVQREQRRFSPCNCNALKARFVTLEGA
ncbi:MAG: hypothetical protein JO069_14655 [Verrucomicrobia bacterium]|nr:hypothetical protein [Verrucomicrobiota bacterium]